MNKSIKSVILVTILFGLIVPFIPSLALLQMFLLIPYGIILLFTFLLFIICHLKKRIYKKLFLIPFLIFSIFIASQIFSVFTVDVVQRGRSEIAIGKIKKIKNKTGSFPESYSLNLGINYVLMKDDSFSINYNKGFLITKKYNSKDNTWRTYGWND